MKKEIDHNNIPNLKFNKEWEIKIIPPFGGALVRFMAYCNKKSASIHLDINDSLGYMGFPYWEVYACNDDEVFRCPMEDADQLISHIETALAAIPPPQACT
jgi:hypothetical protein